MVKKRYDQDALMEWQHGGGSSLVSLGGHRSKWFGKEAVGKQASKEVPET